MTSALMNYSGTNENSMSIGRCYRISLSKRVKLTRVLVSLFFSVFPVAYGASPVLKELHPWGAQRGKPFTLTLVGNSLVEGAKIISTLPASFTPLTPMRKEGQEIKKQDELPFLVELQADTPVGLYPIRVNTAEGLSNVLLFSVGVFPELTEKESEQLVHKPANDSPETSEPLPVPVTVNGTLSGPDKDVYKIHRKKGDHLVLEVEARRAASAIDPVVRLLDARKRQIAMSNDAPGLGLDCRLDVSFPTDGDYYLVVHDARFSEQEQNFYRLKIGSFAYAEGIFPLGWKKGEKVQVQLVGGNNPQVKEFSVDLSGLDQKTNFTTVGPPGVPGSLPFIFGVSDLPEVLEPEGEEVIPLKASTVVNGRISKPGEVDRYKLGVTPGEKWMIELTAAQLGTSQLFGRLTILDSKGKRLASGGDDIPNPDEYSLIEPGRTSSDPYVSFEVPQGIQEVLVTVEDLVERGGPLYGYRLLATKQPPDFTLTLNSPYVNVPIKGTVAVSATADRRGYRGPIQLLIPDAGHDLIVEGGYIPAETRESESVFAASRRGVLTLTSKEGANSRIEQLAVWGEATLEDGTVMRRRARGPGLVTEVLGRTGVPDPNLIDRYRPVFAPWLGFELPIMVAKEFPARLVAESPASVRFVQGTEYEIKWHFEADSPDIRPPKKVGVISPGIREIEIRPAEDPKSEYLKEGVFKMRAVERMPLQKFNVILEGEVETGGGMQAVYSRPLTIELVQGYTIEIPATSISLQPGQVTELIGKVKREPTFSEPVTLKADFLPDKVSSQSVEIPGNQEEFRLTFQADASAVPGEHDFQLVSSSLTGSKEKKVPYKISPLVLRLVVSTAGTTSKLVNVSR
jgi:hypothetical protein